MKTSVIIGVIHMTFGVILSYKNHSYSNNTLAIKYEFIPRLLFLLCTFGYMILLIIIKWCIDWTDSPTAPPNLVQTMIAMFLSPGSVDSSTQLYPGQAVVQVILLIIALLSVPVMLFATPFISKKQHALKFKSNGSSTDDVNAISSPLLNGRQHSDSDTFSVPSTSNNHATHTIDAMDLDSPMNNSTPPSSSNGTTSHGHSNYDVHLVPVPATDHLSSGDAADGGSHADSHGGSDWQSSNYNFTDHLITQGIHTIEYVLGTVSNTASYLRLWALSLAHAELAAVFWDKILMQYGIEQESVAFTFIGVAVWSGATFGVLLCMDVLECFLHALRLHWVEFQNKFYDASGYAFHPFRFSKDAVA